MPPPRLAAMTLPRSPEALEMLEAAWGEGRAVLPLDPLWPAAERDALLERMRPHELIDGDRVVELPDPAPVDEDTALVIATSGTTGPPKGVVLSHRAVASAASLSNEAVGARRGDAWLCCLPVSHVAGLMTLVRTRALGGVPVVHERFEVNAFRKDASAAFLSLVPTMLDRLIAGGADLSAFRRILVGGARVPGELRERARHTGARITFTYGMSETCGGVVYDGTPLPGVRVSLENDGRIVLSTPTLMDGYRLDAASTRAALTDEGFRTSDRGELVDGRLRVLGRLDRVIVTGGKKVAPDEVEAALVSHPQVSAALVRGEPDDSWGERVVALVVPAGPGADLAQADLLGFLRGLLAPYAVPKAITFVEELPKAGG